MGPESAMIFFPSYITTLQGRNLVSDTLLFGLHLLNVTQSDVSWNIISAILPNETCLGPVAETPSIGSEIFPAYVTRVMPQSAHLKEEDQEEDEIQPHQIYISFCNSAWKVTTSPK